MNDSNVMNCDLTSSTPQLDVPFIDSVLNDLAAHDLTDLEAENEFWRAVGLSEVSEDRRPLSLTTKIGGRLMFRKVELDRVLEKGDHAPRRGRPRKDGK